MLIDAPAVRIRRTYLAQDFKVENWETLEPFYEELSNREINSLDELKKWLQDADEVEAAIYEEMAWRYIRQSCDTKNEDHTSAYRDFIQSIMPQVAVFAEKFQRKFLSSEFVKDLDQNEYEVPIRVIRGALDIFREENVQLLSDDRTKSQEYLGIYGGMSIDHDGKTMTLQQAAKYLEVQDREERKEVWIKTAKRRFEDREKVDALLDDLIENRHKIAKNAGFESFTNYAFAALGRFDYTLEDCKQFHQSIEEIIKPVYRKHLAERKNRLGVEQLKPWDLNIDVYGDEPLKPFDNSDEMSEKTIALFSKMKPQLGEMIRFMKANGFLDLDSRPGKAPGGYNYPLAESGVPFIFMNAVGTQTDLTTILHECGHAFHTFSTHDLRNNIHKNLPSEVAELASMSMELMTLDHWDMFYENPDELQRAKREQVSRTLTLFPWIATVDAFQMWLYDNPGHTWEARHEAWKQLYLRFHGDDVSWAGLDNYLETLWQKQGHIMESPFYYIEYGIAQLGALAIWRNFRNDPETALQKYLEALQAGYTRPIPEIYEKAGIRFDFSSNYVREIVDFTVGEIDKLDLN